jgi:predicted DNA-binding protein
MSALSHRLQILLDEERHQRVVALAQARGVSVAAVIREAIDRGLPSASRQRDLAADRILAAEPMEVPDVPELLDELTALRERRA